MNLSLPDWFALSPLLILFLGSMLVLTLETKKLTTVAILLVAGIFSAYAPVSQNPLLTSWLSFESSAHFFNLFFILIGIAVVWMSPSYHAEYFFFVLSALSGLVLIGSSANFLTLFLGIEILSLPLYILCGYIKNQTLSHESAIKYFLTGALATAFIVYGIALIYGATGTIAFQGLLEHYHTTQEPLLFLTGIVFLTLALAFKAAIVPFHQWAPDVYAASPTSVTALMAVGTKVGAFAAFIRLFLVALPLFNPEWNLMIAWLSALTLIYANFVAMKQTQLRRFFAYSGIAQAGFLLIPLVSGTELTPLLFYLVIYAVATLGCFSMIRILENSPEGINFNDLYGLFRQNPTLAIFFSLCLLTLAGIPPTAGFLGKFFILKEAFGQGYILLGLIGLLTSVLSIYYYLRPISLMLAEKKNERPMYQHRLVLTFCCLLLVAISLFPSPLWEYLRGLG